MTETPSLPKISRFKSKVCESCVKKIIYFLKYVRDTAFIILKMSIIPPFNVTFISISIKIPKGVFFV